MKLAFLLYFSLAFQVYSFQTVSWYVSNAGSNSKQCGLLEQPCRDISYAIHKASQNDSIFLIADKNLQVFQICQNNTPIYVNKSLAIAGIDHMPLLYCDHTIDFVFLVKGFPNQIVTLTLKNLAFSNNVINEKYCNTKSYGIIKSYNASIVVEKCNFINVCTAFQFIPTRSDERAVVSIMDSEFTNTWHVIKAEYINKLDITMVATKLKGNTKKRTTGFSSHAITVKCYEQITLFMEECVISEYNEGVSITVKEIYLINIEKSIFTLNEGQSIIITFLKNSNPKISYARISDVQFVKNSGIFASSIHLASKAEVKNNVIVKKCIFYDNLSETFFGAVYADGVTINIIQCDFLNNLAGEYHGAIQGFGGAIYVEGNAKVLTEQTTFINNTSSGFGGTVFSRGVFQCIDCSFIGASNTNVRPLLGDIIYATEGLTLVNTSWKTTISHDGPNSLIWHPGSPTTEQWKIVISGYFEATCPVGHNISHYGIVRKSDGLTNRVFMSCKSCAKNEYSLESGSVFLNQANGVVLKKRTKTVQCYNCKYGGICNRGSIKPQNNYYGFKKQSIDHGLKFVPCPVGYCCQGDSCTRYNSCQSKRAGLLCGSCKKGTSENLFNSNCARKTECTQSWFWIIFLPIGFIYILCFMYLDKISTFVSRQLIWWEKKIHHDDLEDYELIDHGMFSSSDPFENGNSDEGMPENSPILETSIKEHKADDITSNSDNCRNHKIFHPHGKKERGPDAFTDILTISFYFYQMFLIIRMQESIVIDYTFQCVRTFYSSIFTLSIQGNAPIVLCPVYGLTAVTKLLIVKSFACYVLALLLCFHAVVYLVQFLFLQDLRRKQTLIIFSVRLKVATIQILLVSYATLSTTALTLVNCMTMYDQQVLFIDGTIMCYTWWQVLIFIFVVGWVLPFPFVMVTSLLHLKREIISYHQFVRAWTLPLFYLIVVGTNYLTCFNCKNVSTKKSNVSDCVSEFSVITEEKLSINEILFRMECPYNGNKNHLSTHLNAQIDTKHLEPVVWQGTLIGRRLILILTLNFIKAPVSRLYCALFICILYLVHHLYYRPYILKITNIFETVTSVTLVLFCSMNLFFAYSYVSDLAPETADENLTTFFRWTEAVILVLIPVLVGILLVLLLLTRLIILFTNLFLFCVKYTVNM